jgi:hypothetical protein
MASTPYYRRVAEGRWVVPNTSYALEALPDGSYQFFSYGTPVFTVETFEDAEQALADLVGAMLL